MAGENESLICVESGEAGADRGFRGQVCGEKQRRGWWLVGLKQMWNVYIDLIVIFFFNSRASAQAAVSQADLKLNVLNYIEKK